MQRSSAVLCLGLGLIVLCSGQRAPVPAEPFDVRGTKHPEAAIVEVQQKPGLVPLDIEGIYGSLDNAKQCMALVRYHASITLNYADTLSSCLRMSFHDASERETAANGKYEDGTGGANGSVMNELDDPVDNGGNFGLQACHSYMRVFVPMVRASGCPDLTFADAIQMVAGTAVAMAGGPDVPLLPGRPDCGNCFDNANILPSECFTLGELLQFWTDRNMSDPVRATVALNGAHNLGNVRSTTAHDRNSFLGFSGQGPVCIGNPGPLSAHPNQFDNHYYKEVTQFEGRAGYLFSDKVLMSADNTSTIAKEYAADVQAFFEDWTTFFQEMGMIGIDLSNSGYSVHDGFLPGGNIKRVFPMQPNPDNGFAGSDSNYTFEIQTLPSDLSAGEGGESNNVATDTPQTVKEPITAAEAPAAYAAQGPSAKLTPNLNALSPKPDGVDPKGVAPATAVAGRR